MYVVVYRFVMVQAQVLEKSSSPMVLAEGNWWEALQNRYVLTLASEFHHFGEN